jgi:hypothetical protein
MNTPLFRWLRKLTAPLLFDDEEKTSVARILNIFSLSTTIGLLLVTIIARFLIGKEASSIELLVLLAITIVLVIVEILLHAGYVHGYAVLLVISFWIVLTYQARVGDDVNDRAVIVYMFIIVLAGLLLGWIEAVTVTVLSIMVLWALAYNQQNGIHLLFQSGQTPTIDNPL